MWLAPDHGPLQPLPEAPRGEVGIVEQRCQIVSTGRGNAGALKFCHQGAGISLRGPSGESVKDTIISGLGFHMHGFNPSGFRAFQSLCTAECTDILRFHDDLNICTARCVGELKGRSLRSMFVAWLRKQHPHPRWLERPCATAFIASFLATFHPPRR